MVRDDLAWSHPAGGRVFLIFSVPGGVPTGIVFDTHGGAGPSVPAMCDWCHCMSAGTGVIHSEFNGSREQPVHFLQIWIVPAVEDVEPAYQQFAYNPEEKRGRLRLIAGPDKNPRDAAAFGKHERAGGNLGVVEAQC